MPQSQETSPPYLDSKNELDGKEGRKFAELHSKSLPRREELDGGPLSELTA